MQVGLVGVNGQNYSDYKNAYEQKNNNPGEQKLKAYYEFQNNVNLGTKEISNALSDENLEMIYAQNGADALNGFVEYQLNEFDKLNNSKFNYLESEEVAKTSDGKVDTAKYIENGKAFANALFGDWNTNGDDGVDYNEYYAYEFKSYEDDIEKDIFNSCVESMFKTYDLNDDGKISQDEIQSYHVAVDMADGNIDGNIFAKFLVDASVQEELKKAAKEFQNLFMK